jgi:hypothetical protein
MNEKSEEKKLFSIPVLGALWHNENTRRLLTPYAAKRLQTMYVRQAILEFAKAKGFSNGKFPTVRPKFINCGIWQKISKLQQKSSRVDYMFLIAFYWLKELNEFRYYKKSKLIRTAIESVNPEIIERKIGEDANYDSG